MKRLRSALRDLLETSAVEGVVGLFTRTYVVALKPGSWRGPGPKPFFICLLGSTAMQSKLKLVFLAGVISAVCAPAVFAADDGVLVEAAKASWRQDIAQIATPTEGCYQATYPSILWQQVACQEVTPQIGRASCRERVSPRV